MRQAVILAAGFGSRLARHEGDTLKPLREVSGLSLIERNLGMLEQAGIEETIIVVGFRGRELQAQIEEACSELSMTLRFAYNEAYDKANGLSVLCAAPMIRGEFILLMADHIFENAFMTIVGRSEIPSGSAALCIDLKVDEVFDIDDATKVVTDGTRVLEISKTLPRYNAIDTGMFLSTPGLLEALAEARDRNGGDCSLSEGVATLCESGQMFVIDIGDAFWQDVDTEMALVHAEKSLRERRRRFYDRAGGSSLMG